MQSAVLPRAPASSWARRPTIARARAACRAGSRVGTPDAANTPAQGALEGLQRCSQAAAAAAVSLALMLGALSGAPAAMADEEGVTVKFKASANPEIAKAQSTLVEAWAYVSGYYLDDTFNGVNWRTAAVDALSSTYKATSAQEVRAAMEAMLGRLGDPFTRVLVPDDASEFYQQEAGKMVSTGLGLEARPSGAVVVAFIAPGSPAEAAGVAAGDELLSIDGQPVAGRPLMQLYRQLKRAADVQFRRAAGPSMGSGAAGQAGSSSRGGVGGRGAAKAATQTVRLEPAALDFSAVQWALLPGAGASASSSLSAGSAEGAAGGSSQGQGDVGYIHIATFTETVPAEVQEALTALKKQGARALVLDLRDDPGGAVSAGVDVAKLFLADGDLLLRVQARGGATEEARLSGTRRLAQGLPLAVLINGGSASTSEILAGALRDDAGALLIGERSFGKGRMQRVISLSDGSALLVSTMSYATPSGAPVDKVGLAPDVACKPEVVERTRWQGGSVAGGSLADDPCVRLAAQRLAAPRAS